jgi:phytanoyl-CoA hydroxylase
MFRDMGTLELHSPGGPIQPNSIGFLQPSSKDKPFEELREQFSRQGYLWVKEVLPKADVRTMRQQYFDHLPDSLKRASLSEKEYIGVEIGG